MTSALLAVVFAAVTVSCAAAETHPERSVRLAVPRNLSSPVLKLEGFEFVAGEGITLEVLGPADPKTKTRPVLAVSGLVGSGERGGVETMDLVVPLNERASHLLANRSEITLTLRLRRGHHPLKWKRAYLTSA